jgi:hypothetical protein
MLAPMPGEEAIEAICADQVEVLLIGSEHAKLRGPPSEHGELLA